MPFLTQTSSSFFTKKEGCATDLFWFTSENKHPDAFPPKNLRSAGFAERKSGCDGQTFKTDSIGQIHSLATSMQVFRLPHQELRFFLNRCLRALPLKFGFNQTSFRMCMSGIYMHVYPGLHRVILNRFWILNPFQKGISIIQRLVPLTMLPDQQGCQIARVARSLFSTTKTAFFAVFSTNF